MAFGLVYPRRRANFGGDRENKYRTYAMTQKMYDRYFQHFDSIVCHDIHTQIMGRAFDLRDPEEREAFEAAGAHDDKCTDTVARAAKWAIEIIGEEKIQDELEQAPINSDEPT